MADGEISPKSPSLHSDATRILTAIDKRIERRLKDGARISSTWGTVGEVDAGVHEASAYLYGETDGAYMSGGFRIPETQYLTVGDVVKVNINYDTDERWVEEVNVPAAYKPLLVDSVRASVAFGPGTAAASSYIRWDSPYAAVVMDEGDYGDANAWNVLGELRLYRASGAAYVLLTDPTNLNASSVAFAMKNTGEMQWGPSGATRDVTFARDGSDSMTLSSRLVLSPGTGNGSPQAILAYGYIDSYRDGGSGRSNFRYFENVGDTQPSISMYISSSGERGISLGPGGSTGQDVQLYRAAATANQLYLASGDSFEIVNGSLTVGGTAYVTNAYATGDLRTGGTTGGEAANGVYIRSSGGIELRHSSTPYIDFKTTNIDYDARIVMSSGTQVELLGADFKVNGSLTTTSNRPWRYVPLTSFSEFVTFSASTADDASPVLVEITAIPANTAVAVEMLAYFQNTAGSSGTAHGLIYSYADSDENPAAIDVYGVSSATGQYQSQRGFALVGGTNGRQVRRRFLPGGNTCTFLVRAIGYWVEC